jgi:HSP20 family protein
MTITPYNRNSIFSLFDDFERSFFDSTLGNLRENAGSSFRTDIREQGDVYLLEAELPGLGKENIHIDLQGNTLVITAKKGASDERKHEHGSYIRRERRYGEFTRSFDVSGIDTDSIGADYHNGVLMLRLPKKTNKKPAGRRIEIGSGDDGPFLEEANG